MTHTEAIRRVLSSYKDSKCDAAYKLKDGYLVTISPTNLKEGDYMLDNFFKVDSSGKVTEYSPVMDPEEFKSALKKPVFKR